MIVKYGFFDSEGLLLRELDETERHGITAVGEQVARRHTCMIARSKDSDPVIGSGTLVRIGRNVFVATAKHVVRGLEGQQTIGVLWGTDDCRAAVTGQDIVLHDQLDLAAIRLSGEAIHGGIALNHVAADFHISEDGLFVVSGIPVERVRIDLKARTVSIGHWSLGLVCLPTGAWPERSEQPLSRDVDMLLNYTEHFALDDQGKPMPQIAPFGLSGGGIWSVPGQTDGVWSPTAAKLVAVQWGVERDKWKYILATGIKHWLRLLASAYPDTRDDIENVFPHF